MKSILLLSVLLLSACASVKSDVRTPDSDAAARKLTSYARSLVGIPYKYGGNSPDKGFDCSGFVVHVFRHTLGINLPRSSDQISHLGQAISAAATWFFSTHCNASFHISGSIWAVIASFMHPAAAAAFARRICAKLIGKGTTTARGALLCVVSLARLFQCFRQLEH